MIHRVSKFILSVARLPLSYAMHITQYINIQYNIQIPGSDSAFYQITLVLVNVSPLFYTPQFNYFDCRIVTVGLAICDFLYVVKLQLYVFLHGHGDIKPQTSDTCKWQSINGRACAHTSSDGTAQKTFLLYGTAKQFEIW